MVPSGCRGPRGTAGSLGAVPAAGVCPGSRPGWPCRLRWGGVVPCRAAPGPVPEPASPDHQRARVVAGRLRVVYPQGSQPMQGGPSARCKRDQRRSPTGPRWPPSGRACRGSARSGCPRSASRCTPSNAACIMRVRAPSEPLWNASTADTCECAEANNWRGGRLRRWTVPIAEYLAPGHAQIFTIGIAKQRTLGTARSGDDTQARDLTSAPRQRCGRGGAPAALPRGIRSRGRTSHRRPPERMTRPHPLGRAHR